MNIGEYSPRRSRGEYSPIFTSLRRIIVFNSIITQVIIEIPKQRNVTILPQFAIVDKSLVIRSSTARGSGTSLLLHVLSRFN